jgi:hypothetical protein
VQIHVAHNGEQSRTVMAAATVDGRVRPLFALSKARQCDQRGPGSGVSGARRVDGQYHWMDDEPSHVGEGAVPAKPAQVPAWSLHSPRSGRLFGPCLRLCPGDGDELRFVLHFTPPGLADPL